MYKVLDGEVGSSGTKAGSALSAHVAVSKNAITQWGPTLYEELKHNLHVHICFLSKNSYI